MSEMSNSNKITANYNYFIRADQDGNRQLIKCFRSGGYRTITAAKEAEIKEIQNYIGFCCEEIKGFKSDVEKAKTKQGCISSYSEINALLDEIEKARNEEEKVRRLSLEDDSL